MDLQQHASSSTPLKKKPFIIYPEDIWKQVFDFVVSMLMLYFCIVIPFRIAFCNKLPEVLISYELVFDMFLLIDVALTFFTAYQIDITLIENHKEIAKNYIKKKFIFDFIACFPFYLINPHLYWLKIPRYLHATKIFPAFKTLFSTLVGSEQHGAEWKKIMILIQVLNFLTKLGLGIHLIACMWVYIVVIEPYDVTSTWMIKPFPNNYETYVASIYWTVVTFVTVGYGDITPKTDNEVVFTMFVQMQGIVFFAYLMGKVTTFVSDYSKKHYSGSEKESDLNRWLFQLDSSNTRKYMQHKLEAKIIEYFKFTWKHEQLSTLLESSYVMRMPQKLRESFLDYIYEEEVKKFSSFLENAEKSYSYKIISHMQPRQVVKKNTVIIEIDQHPTEVFFINTGGVIVSNSNNKNLVVFPNQSHFAEDLVLFQEESSFVYKSASRVVEFFILNEIDYCNILSQFPEVFKKSQRRAFIRKKFLEKIDEACNENENNDKNFEAQFEGISQDYMDFSNELKPEEEEEFKDLIETSQIPRKKKLEDLQEIADKFAKLNTDLTVILSSLKN